MDTFDVETTRIVALATFPYCLDSNCTGLIGKNLREICNILSKNFMTVGYTGYVTGAMKNLAALKAHIKKYPEIGNIKLEAVSGMYKHRYHKTMMDSTIAECEDRDFNPGVNTFRLYDPSRNEIYYTERGTARGEWGWDNTAMFVDGITGQNMQALYIRKRFDKDEFINKHEDAVEINIGHSKGGHKALICHLHNLISGINDINSSDCSRDEKIDKLVHLLEQYKCFCLNTPCLSIQVINFFCSIIKPSFDSGFLTGEPELFIRDILSRDIHLFNMESDFASSVNEKNTIGKVHIFKQTHGNAKNGHDAFTFCQTEEDSNGKLHFAGGVTPQTKEYSATHKYISNFWETFDSKLSRDKKRQALTAILTKVDEKRNCTNCDVHGALYYEKDNKHDETKKSDSITFIIAFFKSFSFKNLIRMVIDLFHKAKKVEDESVLETIKTPLVNPKDELPSKPLDKQIQQISIGEMPLSQEMNSDELSY